MTDVNVDQLPPTQYLILDDLGGRWRSGETLWTFPSRLRVAVEALAALGLVGWKSGVVERTIQVWLTDAGQEAVLDDAYLPPPGRKLARIKGLIEASMLVDSTPTTMLELAYAGVLAQVRMEVGR